MRFSFTLLVVALAAAVAAVAVSGASARDAVEVPAPVVPSLMEVAASARGACKAGHQCPIPGSVCCPGGETCCRYGCDTKMEPAACLPNPEKRQKQLERREAAISKKENAASDSKRADRCSNALRRERAKLRKLRRTARKCSARARRFGRQLKSQRKRKNMPQGRWRSEPGPTPWEKKGSRRQVRRGGGRRRGGRKGSRKAGRGRRSGKKRGRRSRGKGGKRLDVAKLRKMSQAKLVRVVERMYKQRQWAQKRLRKAGVVRRYASCKEIKAKNPKAKSGRYVIRLRRGHLHTVHCDMVTEGGGWTSLLNPESFPVPTFPGLLFEPTTVSGTDQCSGSDFVRQSEGFNTIYHYQCGDVVSRSHYRWKNVLGATDVMLRATLQGETVRTMAINGRYVGFSGQYTPAANADSKGSCVFYSGEKWSTVPGVNRCAATAVPQRVKPLVLTGWLSSSESLNLKMESGKAALPSSQYGTGWTISTLMVR